MLIKLPPILNVKAITLVPDLELLEHLLGDPVKEAGVHLLSVRHDEVEDLVPDGCLPLVVSLLVEMVVLDGQAHVILVHPWILRDEVRVYLLLLGVFEHHLDESLEVVRYLLVLAQGPLDLVDVLLRIGLELEVDRRVEKALLAECKRRLIGCRPWHLQILQSLLVLHAILQVRFGLLL